MAKLTAAFVKNVPLVTSGTKEYPDIAHGLVLVVTQFAKRWKWRASVNALAYARDRGKSFEGIPPNKKIQIRHTIGDVDLISISEARQITQEWSDLANRGMLNFRTMRERGRLATVESGDISFRDLFKAYVISPTGGKKISEAWLASRISIYERIIDHTEFADLMVRHIQRTHISALLEGLHENYTRGGKRVINFDLTDKVKENVHTLLGRVFKWSIKNYSHMTNLEVNPYHSFEKPDPTPPRTYCMDEVNLKAFATAVREVGFSFARALEFILRTGVRKSEATGLRWRDIDFNRGLVRFEKTKIKKNIVFYMPLIEQTLALLPDRGAAGDDDPVFGVTSSTNTVMNRICAHMQNSIGDRYEHVVIHDIRRNITTFFFDNGVDREVRDYITHHIMRDVESVHYNTSNYLERTRPAYQLWNDYLDGLLVDVPLRPNVIIDSTPYRKRKPVQRDNSINR